jgi:hypothetical protein
LDLDAESCKKEFPYIPERDNQKNSAPVVIVIERCVAIDGSTPACYCSSLGSNPNISQNTK